MGIFMGHFSKCLLIASVAAVLVACGDNGLLLAINTALPVFLLRSSISRVI